MSKTSGLRPSFDSLFSLVGRSALVTGAAKGIGKGIAERLAEAGANVCLADIDVEQAQEVASKINGPTKAFAIKCDVASETSIKSCFEEAKKQFDGNLDILVNNAGIYPMNRITEMSVEDWDHVQKVNLRSMFIASRQFVKHQRKTEDPGVIINIGSIDSYHPSMVGLGAYDASKGGALMFTKAFALEAAAHNVRVNMIAPGAIATPGTQQGFQGLSAEEGRELADQFASLVPLGRWGQPHEIGAVAVFLASPAASYMTGTSVVVDGGRLLK